MVFRFNIKKDDTTLPIEFKEKAYYGLFLKSFKLQLIET
jgi:hypothetical protein